MLTPAQAELAAKHWPLVAARARSYHASEAAMEDLVGWGAIGLCKAAASWNGDGRAKFSTFAFRAIHAAIVDGLRAWTHSRSKNGGIAWSSIDHVDAPSLRIAPSAESLAMSGLAGEELWAAVELLPDRLRIVAWHLANGSTLAETASVLGGISADRVSQLRVQVRDQMREILSAA